MRVQPALFLPALCLLGMATDRSVPCVHRETRRTRSILRFGDGAGLRFGDGDAERGRNGADGRLSPPVRKYTYMTADYAPGSIEGGIAQPSQQHTWDPTYVSDKPNNTLFTLHPFYSGKELAMFFPLERYEWIEEEAGWRWRSRDRRNGIVLEAGSEGECGSFEDFKRSIRAAGVERRDSGSSLTVAHRTRRGAEMRFTCGGPRLLDGKPADPARHMAFDGPFLRSEAGSGIVTMTHGGRGHFARTGSDSRNCLSRFSP